MIYIFAISMGVYSGSIICCSACAIHNRDFYKGGVLIFLAGLLTIATFLITR